MNRHGWINLSLKLKKGNTHVDQYQHICMYYQRKEEKMEKKLENILYILIHFSLFKLKKN